MLWGEADLDAGRVLCGNLLCTFAQKGKFVLRKRET